MPFFVDQYCLVARLDPAAGPDASGLNSGVDFIGGQMIRTTYADEKRHRASAGAARTASAQARLSASRSIQQLRQTEIEVSIRMKLPDGVRNK
jgi:preprotein translocase subunit SecF